MDLQLSGKRALVTGSTSGIGEATARQLASEGVAVVVHGRNHVRAREVARSIQESGGKAGVALGDLATDDGAQAVAQDALALLGGIDILVNLAGVPEFTGWADTSAEQWQRLYNNNVVSMVRMIGLVVPQMKGLGWGRVINTGSVVATRPFAEKPHYCAGRAAIVNLTLSLAQDLAETGITVNTVSPGIVFTPPAEKFFLEMAEKNNWKKDWKEIEKNVLRQRLYNMTGRWGKAEEVASLIVFLCSPRADYINGANYRIDGGTTCTVN